MMQYGISDKPLPPERGFSYWGIAIVLAAAVGLVVIILVFLGWADPFDKLKYEMRIGSILGNAILIIGAVGFLALAMLMKPKTNMMASNQTSNATANATANLTANATSPIGPLINPGNASGLKTSGNPTVAGLDVVFLALIVLSIVFFAVFAIRYYRVLALRRKRKQMMETAREFDRKLDEIGLELFKDPREAVVGIYKNAVLWLEALGIPYQESWTHWEHAEHVRLMHETFVALTRLFEKAEYAPEKVTWEDAKTALELYSKMRGGVNAAQ
ncbi:DUF4129 domain-containing protein [Thermococcus sp. Bubb.Bath]|nr:DUF4129 domain-containing protein [Thermococcus sp. Bubb.Bath]